MRRSLTVPSLTALYYETLIAAANLFDQADGAAAPGWLEREASRLLDLVRPAMRADQTKPFTNEEFEAGAEEVLAFARNRGAFVRWEAARRFAPGAGPIY
jgi:hypothetical protein